MSFIFSWHSLHNVPATAFVSFFGDLEIISPSTRLAYMGAEEPLRRLAQTDDVRRVLDELPLPENSLIFFRGRGRSGLRGSIRHGVRLQSTNTVIEIFEDVFNKQFREIWEVGRAAFGSHFSYIHFTPTNRPLSQTSADYKFKFGMKENFSCIRDLGNIPWLSCLRGRDLALGAIDGICSAGLYSVKREPNGDILLQMTDRPLAIVDQPPAVQARVIELIRS